jgi:hypothetical protein
VGAAGFRQYADDPDPAAAFRAARQDARHEHGNGGYTGTIAEKDDYVIITDTPMGLRQAATLAADLMDRGDPRIDDKWGPAGAIAVRRLTRKVTIDHLDGTTTNPAELDPQALAHITKIAEKHGLISQEETVKAGHLVAYQTAGRAPAWPSPSWSTVRRGPVTYTDGTAELTVRKDPTALSAQTVPDGWLFFGWATE